MTSSCKWWNHAGTVIISNPQSTVAPGGNNLMAICLTDFLGLATINMYYYYYYLPQFSRYEVVNTVIIWYNCTYSCAQTDLQVDLVTRGNWRKNIQSSW